VLGVARLLHDCSYMEAAVTHTMYAARCKSSSVLLAVLYILRMPWVLRLTASFDMCYVYGMGFRSAVSFQPCNTPIRSFTLLQHVAM
jgi:hypothetical protein